MECGRRSGLVGAGPDATPAVLIEALQTATRILTAVVRAAEPEARAVIWRRPEPEIRGPADFVPRAGPARPTARLRKVAVIPL